jgi:hypothetical protein
MAQHLIHIGYPKAGSTFLQKWFELHPELCFKHGALGGFHNVFEMARPPKEEHKFYVTSSEGLVMPHKNSGGIRLDYSGKEIEPFDLIKDHQAQVCSRLKDIYPNSQVLIITRGFKSIVMSSYSQSVRMGSAFHLQEMCVELVARIKEDKHHYFDYDYVIKLYAEAFGRENLIILPYELLRDDPKSFLNVIERKLKLTHIDMPSKRVNASLTAEELYWYPIISQKVAGVSSLFGRRVFRKIYPRYISKTLNNKLRLPIKILTWLYPAGRIDESDFPEDILQYFNNRANLLIDDPLYKPYFKEYLW